MAYSEDDIALAAEYALGTLDPDERAQAESKMAADPDYAALVQAWDYKLGALNQMVGLVEPGDAVWQRIKAAIAAGAASTVAAAAPASTAISSTASDSAEPANGTAVAAATTQADEPAPAPAHDAGSGLSPESMRVVHFAKRAYIWQRVALASSALAATLMLVLGIHLYAPDALPEGLRPAVRTRVVTVEAPPPPIPAQYVAVLQKDGDSPAFILTVDAGSKTFTVRRVAATPEPGKSYELWLVSDRLQQPRSLGIIGNRDFTVNPVLSSFDVEIVNKATYAVTIEPEGGSPTGVATGPIVFTGKLVESVPSAAVRAPAQPPRR